MFDEVDIDFTPVYRCVHIHATLGLLEEFQAYYTDNRKLQANLVMQQMPKTEGQRGSLSSSSPSSPPPSTNRNVMEATEGYFHQVAGFFIVEDTVLETTENFVSRSSVESMWEFAVAKLKSLLQQQYIYCTDLTALFQVKAFILIFAQTMGGYVMLEIYDAFRSFLLTIEQVLLRHTTHHRST